MLGSGQPAARACCPPHRSKCRSPVRRASGRPSTSSDSVIVSRCISTRATLLGTGLIFRQLILGVIPVVDRIDPSRLDGLITQFDLPAARQGLLEEAGRARRSRADQRWSERPPRYARSVERSITGYHRDDEGEQVAELSCGHNQHVRHRPPFQLRAWVLDAEGRTGRLGTTIGCPLCDRAELPDGLRFVGSSPEWTAETMPAGLLRAHRVAGGTWGRIVVHDGQLRFAASTEPPLEVVLGPGSTQPVPPDVAHEVLPLGAVRFSIELLALDESRRPGTAREAGTGESPHQPVPDEGGDPACWAGLLCSECGAVLDGTPHRQGCAATGYP